MISAKILADSINPDGSRLTSWLLTYPRIIHAEFMTHRIFSRNAASSRATSFDKMQAAVENDSDVIERWAMEQRGMQGGDALPGDLEIRCRLIWAKMAGSLLAYTKGLHDLGAHKSICNRPLEPFGHITVIATATDHSNFFQLRAHPMAQPEFQVLAYRMLHEYLKSEPELLHWSEWHIPHFGSETEAQIEPLPVELELQVATARCARVSYTTHEKEFSLSDQIALHDRLALSGHWSPFEHCAQALDPEDPVDLAKLSAGISNFDLCGMPVGWLQYRKTFDKECPTSYTREQLLALYDQKPDWIKAL